MSKKSGLAFLVGAAAGALAILFMPDSKRKQTKKLVETKAGELQAQLKQVTADERVQAVFGKVSAETKKAYTQVSQELSGLIQELKDVDQGKYADLVDQVITKVKEGGELTSDQLKKLKQEFISFYEIGGTRKKK